MLRGSVAMEGGQQAKGRRQGRGVKGEGTQNSLGLNTAERVRDWVRRSQAYPSVGMYNYPM